jgi:hypothetical protein
VKTGVSSVIEFSEARRRREAKRRRAERLATARAVGPTTTTKVQLCDVDGCFTVLPCAAHVQGRQVGASRA